MSDEFGNKKYFNANGYITKIKDVMGNEKAFEYNISNQLIKIKYKPVGYSGYIDQLLFWYNTSYALNRITNAQNTSDYVEFYYSSSYIGMPYTTSDGFLRMIQYSNGETSSYNYDSNGILSYVVDNDTGSKISYTYSIGNNNITNKNYRVDTVTEKTSSDVTGQQIGFIYEYKKTSVRSRGYDDVYGNNDDILTTYLFDNEGRTICAYSSNLSGDTIYGTSNAV
ncbi:MAG: hypothetical protein A2Y15_06005 [Clostridiales bacterium GWF2_36_10]|nr:MAG: hypothetical protein A2Y15_06005 [Clostridiales bacterium GWF2_36_10]HAN21588.1 hypothetical protein [Clostridiales bacterium]